MRIIFPFSQKIKKKQKYEKEGQDIHIVRISTTFGCQQVNFLIFPDIITQSTAIVKTKIEVFIKILIEGPLIAPLEEIETSTENKVLVQLLT